MQSLRERQEAAEDESLFRKINWRVLPLLCLCYFFSFLDRTNIGYAQLQMHSGLGLSDTSFGMGVTVFFVGYALFELPSNLLLTRIGFRKTLFRITVLWGIASAMMALVQTPSQFYVARFFVGVFEAGLAPGVLFYLTRWYPPNRIAQATAIFYMAYGVAPILAGPMAGSIMTFMNGINGLSGWQWLFLIEGLSCIPLGIAAYYCLSEGPEEASWLKQGERRRVRELIGGYQQAREIEHGMLRDSLFNKDVWMMGLLVFLVVFGIFALSFWSPTMLKGMGLTVFQVGLYSAIPAVAGVLSSIVVGRHSDKSLERRWHFAIPATVGAAALLLTTRYLQNVVPAIACLAIASAGISSAYTVLFAMPAVILKGKNAAAGIAVITTIGASSGMLAPLLVGVIRAATGSFSLSLYVISAALILAAGLFPLYFGVSRFPPIEQEVSDTKAAPRQSSNSSV